MKFLPTVRQMFTYHFHEIIMVQCFEAECNPCSDRETCTFYRFPKYLKNSHDGWQIVWNMFVFVLYGGCASDKAITADLGIMDKMLSGDTVMVDKGF